MTNHLQKRGARYYIRRKIPQDLTGHYDGRKEVCRALGTSDPVEVRRLVREESVRLDQQWAQARRSLSAAPDKAPRPVREYVLDPVSNPASILPTGRRITHDPARPGMYELLPDGDTAVLWPSGQNDPVHARRLEDARQFLNTLLVARTLEAERAACTDAQSAPPLPGSIAPPVNLALYNSGTSRTCRRDSAPSSASAGHLAALVEAWARERKPDIRTCGIADRVVQRFYSMVGRIPVAGITRAHVIAFKDKLLESGQTPVNTDKQLTMLRALLNFAVANLMAASNPAQGVKVGARKNARAARLPFDLPALKAIFGSPVYTVGERPEGGAKEAAYWLPLLGLFTGARVEELCQLEHFLFNPLHLSGASSCTNFARRMQASTDYSKML